MDRAFLQAGAGRGGEAALAGHRSPVLQQEVELHRNSLRREADTALRLAGDIRWVHASHYRVMLTNRFFSCTVAKLLLYFRSDCTDPCSLEAGDSLDSVETPGPARRHQHQVE